MLAHLSLFLHFLFKPREHGWNGSGGELRQQLSMPPGIPPDKEGMALGVLPEALADLGLVLKTYSCATGIKHRGASWFPAPRCIP